MFHRLQHFFCLAVVLYLLGCLVHDIYVYHDVLGENAVRIEREEQTRQIRSRKLDDLLRMIEEPHLSNRSRKADPL